MQQMQSTEGAHPSLLAAVVPDCLGCARVADISQVPKAGFGGFYRSNLLGVDPWSLLSTH